MLELSGHIMVHSIIVTLSALLLTVSFLSYLRQRRNNLLFVWGAFLVFTAREVFLFINAVFLGSDVTIPVVGTELSHFLGFGVVALLTLGILRR